MRNSALCSIGFQLFNSQCEVAQSCLLYTQTLATMYASWILSSQWVRFVNYVTMIVTFAFVLLRIYAVLYQARIYGDSG